MVVVANNLIPVASQCFQETKIFRTLRAILLKHVVDEAIIGSSINQGK